MPVYFTWIRITISKHEMDQSLLHLTVRIIGLVITVRIDPRRRLGRIASSILINTES